MSESTVVDFLFVEDKQHHRQEVTEPTDNEIYPQEE